MTNDGVIFPRVVGSVAAGLDTGLDTGLAADLNRGAGQCEVTHRFARSLYLRVGAQLICIGDPSIGCGALNVLVSPADWATLGSALDAGATLGVGCPKAFRYASLPAPVAGSGIYWLDFEHALPWCAPHVPLDMLPSAENVAFARAVLARETECAELGPPGGGDQIQGRVQVRAKVRVQVGVDALVHWLTTLGHAPVPVSVTRLLGTGPGLTPAGDDVLVGVLLALKPPIRARLANALLRLWSTATTQISVAHLTAAAQGEGAHVAHVALAALYAAPSARLERALRALLALGESSGRHCLLGMLTVLEGDLK